MQATGGGAAGIGVLDGCVEQPQTASVKAAISRSWTTGDVSLKRDTAGYSGTTCSAGLADVHAVRLGSSSSEVTCSFKIPLRSVGLVGTASV